MKILFACGGTGGHVFPGVALAESFEKKVKGIEIVFAGTERGIEKRVIGRTKWRLEMIETPTFANKKWIAKWTAVFGLLKALKQSRALLKRERPHLAIGVGGYVAAPLLIMAALMAIPTLTLEPNAVPGLSNRLLKYFVDKVVIAYPEAQKYFGKKGILLGVPVRGEIFGEDQGPGTRDQGPVEKVSGLGSLVSGPKTIFLFGGSLGAKAINEAILSALPHLADLKDKIHFIHQIGATVEPGTIQQIYQRYGFSAEVTPFIEKMGAFYGKADLVIARSGATSVAELRALNKPSLLIPYPFAQGNHQEANARSLEKLGGAKVLLERELKGEVLAEKIRALITNPGELEKMKSNLMKIETANAADQIVETCLTNINISIS